MLYGYLKSIAQGKPRYADGEFRRFLRRYQWACLLKGKRRATEQVNARQARLWSPPERATHLPPMGDRRMEKPAPSEGQT
jgi:hypothetical protein